MWRRWAFSVSTIFFSLTAINFVWGAEEQGPAVSVPLKPVELRPIRTAERLPIDLPTALRLATANNLEIQEAHARVREVQGEKNRALAEFLPTTSYSFTARKIDGRIQASFGELGDRTFSTLNPAGVFVLSVDPGQALFDTLAAHKLLDAATEQEEGITQQTLLNVASRHFDLEQAQARVAIAEQAVATSQELVRLSRDRESVGTGLKVDVLRAEARLAEDEGRLSQARKEFREASVTLALTLKLDPSVTLFPLEPVVKQLTAIPLTTPLDDLLNRASVQRPEVKELSLRTEAAKNQHTALWWKALGPKVAGTVEESAIGRSFDLGNRQIYSGYIGWTLSPSSIGEIQAARARLDQVKIQTERILESVKAEVIQAREAALTAQEQIEAAHRGVQAAEASLALSQTRLEGGVGLTLEVLEAQAALTTARTALVGAIVQYNKAQAGLLRATGEMSVTALAGSP
ncbi:MAG TPA: TolC family protein [Candidatus Binatia bacterium]|jgi:outer membrane protein TolC|nr:TolC family protein [Candidatus Binatia bacterium]